MTFKGAKNFHFLEGVARYASRGVKRCGEKAQRTWGKETTKMIRNKLLACYMQ